MQLATVVIGMLAWLQLKHYVADYLLQPAWMLSGKGDMRRVGGYVHAGTHGIASIPAYLLGGLGLKAIALFVVVEFVLHYVIDFIKADLSARSHRGPDTSAYWALFGADQLAHQLTYVGLLAASLWVLANGS